MSTQAPAGWYPDPAGSARQRYFDGSAWTEHYAPAQPPSAAAAPGPVIQPLSQTMIETFLKANGVEYTVTPQGFIVADEPYRKDFGCDIRFVFHIDEKEHLLYLSAFLGHELASERWNEAIMACNQYAVTTKIPGALFDTGVSSGRQATFRVNFAFPAESGIHQELLNETVSSFIGLVFEFAKWLRNYMRL